MLTITQPTCEVATGKITLTPVAGLEYKLDGGSWGAYPAGGWTVAVGSHTVYVRRTSDNTCTSSSPATITAAPGAPDAPVLTITQPTCEVATGKITLTPVAGLEYKLDGGSWGAYPAGGWTVAVGSHTVYVRRTSDNTCTSSSPATITAAPGAPDAPVLTITQPTCEVATGKITLTPVAGLEYKLDGGSWGAYPAGGWTVAVGSHTVYVRRTSDNTCTSSSPATITAAPGAPDAPVLTITQPTCEVATGKITLTPVAGLEYKLDGGSWGAYPAGGWTVAVGSHTVYVRRTSDNTCTSSSPATITAAPGAPDAPVLTITQPTCEVATGKITLTPVAGLEYKLDGGSWGAYPAGGWTVAVGSHTVYVRRTSDNTCTSSSPATITAAPGAPDAPVLTITQPTCEVATGKITLTPVAGLEYKLDGGSWGAYPAGGWTVAVGSHTVYVRRTSDNTCTSSSPATINAQPTYPSVPILTKTDATCAVSTGCVTVTSTTTGLTFSFDGGAYVAYPNGGWCGLAPGSTHTVTAKNADGCISDPASITIGPLPVCANYCSYTQGFWGNKNGAKLLPGLLTTPITIGRAGHSVYIPAGNTSALKINMVMPGGLTPTVLRAGDCSINNASCFNAYLTKQGKINNVLLSQTITLSLNIRLADNPLSSFPIQSGCVMTSGGSFELNHNVVNYLTYNGATATVADLLNLANDLLGAVLTPGANMGSQDNPRIVPSYSDVNSAVDAINKGFDGCRSFYGYETCTTDVLTTSLPARVETSLSAPVLGNQVKVMTSPNPFNDVIRFTIQSATSGQGSLEVFNTLGQKVNTVYQGFVRSGVQSIEYRVPVAGRQNLIYVFTMNGQKLTGKLINLRGQ